MNCEVVYSFRPRKPIADVIAEQARKKAKKLVYEADVHMGLEAQSLSDESFEREINRLADQFANTLPRDLWDKED